MLGKENRAMPLTRLMPSLRRSFILLGLVVTATASGARPMSVGARAAAPSVAERSSAVLFVSDSRASAPAGFEVQVKPNSGVSQGDLVSIYGTAPVDSANLVVKLTVTPP